MGDSSPSTSSILPLVGGLITSFAHPSVGTSIGSGSSEVERFHVANSRWENLEILKSNLNHKDLLPRILLSCCRYLLLGTRSGLN